MFGIGSTELVVILLVALLILGPKKLPQIARTLGKALGEFKRMSSDFQRTVNADLERDDMERRKKDAEKELFEDKKEAPAAEAASAEKADKEPVKVAEASPKAAAGTGDK